MEIVGWVFTVILAVIAVLAVLVGLRSIPDLKRYFKIRNM